MLVSATNMSADQKNYFLYVGVYGKGIYAYRFDAANGQLESLSMVGEVANPSFLAVDRDYRYLYAVSEVEGKANGAVAGFSIDRSTGKLTFLNSRSSAGEAPCHLAVDETGKMLLAANYGTGSVPTFPIEAGGKLGEMPALTTATGSSVNQERQSGPHAHQTVISADNRFAYVPDLGLDQIHIYRLDPANAKLLPNNPPYAKEAPGLGPRHMVISPNGKFVYVINELTPVVTIFSRDPATGGLHLIQTVPSVPEGFKGKSEPAEILIDRAGKFIYASNRGPGTIAVFAIDQSSGKVHAVQFAEIGGTWPRGVEFDPTGRLLFAGDEKGNNFVIFKVDPASGKLTLTGQKYEVPSPVAFLFVPAK